MKREFLKALAQVISEESDYFYRYAFKLLGKENLAEEAVQDMVAAALTGAERFEQRSSLRTYLTSILRFKCLDLIRADVKRRVSFVDTDLSDCFQEDGHWHPELAQSMLSGPESELYRKQLLKFLADCLKKLTAEQRLIISLGDFDEKSRSEICNETGLTPTNVGVIAFRARNNLRLCIEKRVGPD